MCHIDKNYLFILLDLANVSSVMSVYKGALNINCQCDIINLTELFKYTFSLYAIVYRYRIAPSSLQVEVLMYEGLINRKIAERSLITYIRSIH